MTEYELIKGCLAEDVTCQRLLFQQHAGKMMSICHRYAKDAMEAEDILQDAFVKVYKYMGQYKFEGSFEGWIRKIVVNTALRNVQKKKIHFSEVSDHGSDVPQLEPYAFSNLGEDEILKLIQELPDGYRMVFNLNIIEGFTHEEIAVMLKIQPSTSRSQLVKARKMLQNQILQMQKIAV